MRDIATESASSEDMTLSLRGVTKHFDDFTLGPLDLDIEPGTVVAFVGPNGAGKTTTLRIVMGMLRPDAGTVTVLGSADPLQQRERLAYLPEEKGLYKRMGVAEFLRFFARLRGLSRAEAARRCESWLLRMNLADRADSRCETLSKGMGQKLQLAAALIHEPELVILDEPYSGLDPVNVELVREIILEGKRSGRTTIVSTHVMEQAEQLCDHVVLLDAGEVLLSGRTDEVRRGANRSVIVEYASGSLPTALPGVRALRDGGVRAELEVEEDADTRALLHTLAAHVELRRFEFTDASLHSVFLRNVGRRRGPSP